MRCNKSEVLRDDKVIDWTVMKLINLGANFINFPFPASASAAISDTTSSRAVLGTVTPVDRKYTSDAEPFRYYPLITESISKLN